MVLNLDKYIDKAMKEKMCPSFYVRLKRELSKFLDSLEVVDHCESDNYVLYRLPEKVVYYSDGFLEINGKCFKVT